MVKAKKSYYISLLYFFVDSHYQYSLLDKKKSVELSTLIQLVGPRKPWQ